MKTNISSRKGFSLVEVVIAIGIVAVLLTTFMTVFGPAQKSINKALGVTEANRLVSTLENEMAVLRPNERSEYTPSVSFEKAFQWISGSHEKSTAIVVFQHQAIPNEEDNGRLQPALTEVSDESSLPGVDYITQTVAKRIEDVTEAELSPGVIEGKVYVVRMTQLYNKGGAAGLELLMNGNELKAGIVNSSDDGTVLDDSILYDDAHITLQVEFFPLNNNLHAYVTEGSWDFDKLGTPVATQNIAVRR